MRYLISTLLLSATPTLAWAEPLTFNAALELMHTGRFRHLPVVEKDRPIGMISVRDAMGPELESFVYEMLRQEQVSEVLA